MPAPTLATETVNSFIKLRLFVFKIRHQRGLFLWSYFGQLLDIIMISDEMQEVFNNRHGPRD